MTRIYHIVFAALIITSTSVLFYSCNDNDHTAETKEITKEIITWDTNPAFFTDSMIEEPCDFIPATYADDEQHTTITFPALIIQQGSYHGDEVTEEMKKATWHGLYKNGDNYMLEPTKVQFKQVRDEIVDEGTNMKTGIEVIAKHEGEVLIANAGELKTGMLDKVALDTNIIETGNSYYFEYGGVYYRIYATAYHDRTQDGIGYPIRNYQVFLEKQVDGKITRQLVLARPYVGGDFHFAYIFFAGDLDNDGLPDLVLNVPMENGNNLVLFLSGKAEQGQLLKAMAIHTSVGC